MRKAAFGFASRKPVKRPTAAVPTSPPAFSAAVNMGKTFQYGGFQPYINLIKATFQDYGPGGVGITTDSNDDLLTLNSGSSVSCKVWDALSNGLQLIKTGQYRIKWDGPNVPLTISCAGSSGFVQTGTSAVVTIPQVGVGSANAFTLSWLNNTGGTAFALTNLRVYHIDHEALFDAGEIFNPDYIAALGTRLPFIRCLDPSQINNNHASTIAQLRLESSRSWASWPEADPVTITGMPYTVAAKLAVKLNCDLHINAPVRGTQVQYDEIARLISTVSSFMSSSLKIRAEMSNENWNDGFNHKSYLNGTWGPAQTPVLSAPQAEAQKALMLYKALALYFPRARVHRVFCGQVGDGFGAGGYFDLAMKYVDTANLIGTGGTSQYYTLIDEVCVAPYTHISSAGADLYHSRLMNIDWVTRTDAQIDAYFAEGQSVTLTRLTNFYNYMAALRPAIILGSYEWGQEVTKSFAGLVGQGYEFKINTANNTAVWELDYPATFTNGDVWRFFHNQLTSAYPYTTYTNGTDVYIKAKDSTQAWFFATDAARLADTGNTGAGAIVLNSTPTTDEFWGDSYTRTQQLSDRIKTYLDATVGKEMYERLRTAHVGVGKLQNTCHYFDFSGYHGPSFVDSWGLKRSIYAADTARSAWYKTL